MKIWSKALVLAASMEAPIAGLLIHLSDEATSTVLKDAIVAYHIVPLSALSAFWLSVFGHGSPTSLPLWMAQAVYWVLVFFIQTVISAPIVFGVLYFFRKSATPNSGCSGDVA